MSSQSIEIPDLQGLLGDTLDPDFEITNYLTTNLTAIGDNYGSLMLALTVNLENKLTKEGKTMDLVAKMTPRNPMFFQVFQVPLSFPKETSMYTKVSVAINDHQRKHKVPIDLQLDSFCKCYGVRRNLKGTNEVDTDAIFVLENLKKRGFGCGERSRGFNKKDTEFILKNLARFHGVPIAIRYLTPEVFESEIMPSLKKINMTDGMPEAMMTEVIQVNNQHLL